MSWLISNALMKDYVNSLCLQEQVVGFSEENYLTGKHCAQSKLTDTQLVFCAQDKMTAFSRLSRSGTTYKPLMGNLGEDLLMWYLGDSHARTYHPQEKELALQENVADCGQKWQGLLAKYDQDSHSLKTAQCSLLEDSIPSLVILPRFGTMRNGCVYQRQSVEHHINETESGYLLPTPTANQMGSNTTMRKRGTTAKQIYMNYPTPRAGDGLKTGNINQNEPRNGLPAAVKKYPTPKAKDATATDCPSERRRNSPCLLTVVKKYPTPQASDHRNRGGINTPAVQRRIKKGKQISLSMTTDGGELNPTWTEKLMGFPDDWTSLNEISHVKYLFWILGFSNEKKKRENEILRVLQKGYVEKEIWQEIGRHVSVYEATVLLIKLCKYAQRADEARVFMESKKAFKRKMRSVQSCKETSSSPRGSGYKKQRTRKYSDTMQKLSRLLAHHGKTYWENNSWEDAVPSVAHGVASRVDRLKAIGNGQVPIVAATAFKILYQRLIK